ncbi:hypothetical protein EVAR_99778_1 [Eumeta japonica]|uniref:Ig-like domain-containing protein n=1 Tax=Eumeta variegata TaxID=151549 RepID=A0A4C1ZKC8_EUMVA|nr:hypothetical protein EVAR_99778_1 [Eumeta japonica]
MSKTFVPPTRKGVTAVRGLRGLRSRPPAQNGDWAHPLNSKRNKMATDLRERFRLGVRYIVYDGGIDFIGHKYHNSRMINYDLERGVNVTTDAVQRISDLSIPSANAAHAGNYTCVPNNAVPASIYVHIFNGKPLQDK